MDISKKIMIGIGSVCVFLVLLVSFTLAYSGRDVTLLQDRSVNMTVNGYPVLIPLDKDGVVYDLPCITTSRDNTFRLNNDAGANIKIEGNTLKTGRTTKVGISRIADNYQLTMTVESSKDTRTIYLRTKSSVLPTMEATGKSDISGHFCVTSADSPAMFVMGDDGSIVWYLAMDKTQTNGDTFANLQKHILENGDVYYSYHQVQGDIDKYGISDYYPGKTVIMNSKFEIIDHKAGGITLLKADGSNDADVPGEPTDGHAFILMGDNDYITESTVVTRVDNIPTELNPNAQGTKVAAAVVQIVADGKPTLTWDSTKYPELYRLSASGNTYSSSDVQDYLHINGMVMDPSDGNVILSFKNANALVKINADDGKIMWILGGTMDQFGLSDAQKPQHLSDLTVKSDGALTVMDGSRILTYTIDQDKKAVTDVKETPLSGHDNAKFGNATLLDSTTGTYAIGWGTESGSKTLLTVLNSSTEAKELEVVCPDGEAALNVNWTPAETKE